MAEWGAEGFSPLARALVAFLARLRGSDSAVLSLSTALCVAAVERGHTCLDIRFAGGKTMSEVLGHACPEGREGELLPPAPAWEVSLRAEADGLVGAPGARAPLVIDPHGRLYLHRYWCHEQTVARGILSRLGAGPEAAGGEADPLRLRESIDRLFGPSGESPDWQRIAAATAVMRRFAVVSGGPGTGKTYTLVRIIALAAEEGLRRGAPPLVALAAPTGKAANRLAEAVRAAREGLRTPTDVMALIPAEASTLHRLLAGVRHRGDTDEAELLPHDLVVVDECSMADVSLMASLFGALRPGARLVLAGDKDQLASVEAGVVMADICDTGREHGYAPADAAALQVATGQAVPEAMLRDAESGLAASISVLRRNHRMPDQGGIARVARAVNRGDAEEVLDLVTGGAGSEVRLLPYGTTGELHELVVRGTLPWFREYLAADEPEQLFQAYGRRAVLCALRRGPTGVEGVNRAVVSALRRAGDVTSPGVLFAGLPLVVTVNDYSVRLWNGDVGIMAPPRLGGGARCLFARAEGGFRHVSPARLPPHEPAFALTVHKSQGSEFDDVVLVLPSAPTPVASRELLYTALTRARSAVTVLGSPLVLRWMVEHPTVRSSGLRDLLWLS